MYKYDTMHSNKCIEADSWNCIKLDAYDETHWMRYSWCMQKYAYNEMGRYLISSLCLLCMEDKQWLDE
jgi:hypothetical protein